MGRSLDKRPNAGKGRTVQERSTDQEILKARRLEESYDASDLALGVFGWLLWGLGAVWFMYFGQATLTWIPGDPTLTLVACGLFCTAMSRASPRGTWSAWRLHWQLLWVPAWALLFFCVAQVAMDPFKAFVDHGWNYAPVSALQCWAWTAGCGLCAVVAGAFYPSGSPRSAKPASAPIARTLFLADMAYGVLAASAAVASAPWRQSLGPQAALFTAVPYAMWGVGTGLCCTQAEMLRALPAALLVHASAIGRTVMFGNGGGQAVLIASATLLVLHLALFLPLPLRDPESNIFYLQRVKLQQRCYRMISDPVPGIYSDDQ